MSSPILSKIRVYPIKSVGYAEVDRVSVGKFGNLEKDRSLAIADSNGKILNAKKCPELIRVRADYNLEDNTVALGSDSEETSVFSFLEERAELGQWFSDYLGRAVEIKGDDNLGFPDDTEASGPTLISTETINIVASWFDDIDAEEVRRRLRTNLEIDGVPAFWEDRLYGPGSDETKPFKLGDLELEGTNACQRCPVVTRNSSSGERIPEGFQKEFGERRKESLPDWAHASRFNHFYRVALNTKALRVPEGCWLALGDILEVL
ncbi:MAG: MOSC domain-containing protein [Opitutales bacterium]